MKNCLPLICRHREVKSGLKGTQEVVKSGFEPKQPGSLTCAAVAGDSRFWLEGRAGLSVHRPAEAIATGGDPSQGNLGRKPRTGPRVSLQDTAALQMMGLVCVSYGGDSRNGCAAGRGFRETGQTQTPCWRPCPQVWSQPGSWVRRRG